MTFLVTDAIELLFVILIIRMSLESLWFLLCLIPIVYATWWFHNNYFFMNDTCGGE